MFAFNYTSTSVTGGANSILSKARLLINVWFPRLIVPAVQKVHTDDAQVARGQEYFTVGLLPGDSRPCSPDRKLCAAFRCDVDEVETVRDAYAIAPLEYMQRVEFGADAARYFSPRCPVR